MKELESKCKCGEKGTDTNHMCPFASEINDNHDDEYCNCCSNCEHECCMDI